MEKFALPFLNRARKLTSAQAACVHNILSTLQAHTLRLANNQIISNNPGVKLLLMRRIPIQQGAKICNNRPIEG